jgi:hypothetical protein
LIPDCIAWITNDALAGAMDISLTQLRRDAAVLKALELIRTKEEEAQRHKGFERHDGEIVWLFRQLVRERGRTAAINSIHQIIEEFYHHERDGQESSRAS